MPKHVDYLSEDPAIAGQKWCLLSFVSPTGRQKCDIIGLKVRGVYGTREEADQRAKHLQKIDSDFDVFVAQVGLWLPFNPNPDSIENEEYTEDRLNSLVKEYKQNKVQADEHFAERKRRLMEQALKDGSKEGQEELADRREHPVAVKKRIEDTENDIKMLQERLETANKALEATKERLSTYTPQEIEEGDREFKELQEKLKTAEGNPEEVTKIHDELKAKYAEDFPEKSNDGLFNSDDPKTQRIKEV